MSKNLVVVESPAKARTLEQYLGKDFRVMASYGHVRDLVPKEGAVDPEHDFRMRYEVIERNQKHVDSIARTLQKSDALYLATDPDREGEAISWHLYELLKERGLLDGKPVHRIVFHEITRAAVNKAVSEPRGISVERVNAQQARRALDYLVGFNLSPLLWKKVRRGLSAGRVQSPALRLICEREAEIQAFVPREYWTLEAEAAKGTEAFRARLTEYAGRKVEQFTFENERDARDAERTLLDAAGGTLEVVNVERKQRRRNPAAPFTTSTLQQEASRKLGFSASRTMSVAQRLYEGVETEEGSVGLITYMRTDSVQLADEAIGEIRELIGQRFGADNLPESPRQYRTKAKNAQEAHEAIRPTSARRTPESLKKHLGGDQLKLYELIWKRTVACQMIHATFDTVGIDLQAGKGEAQSRHMFRATGSVLRFPGFIAVYQEGRDDKEGADESDRLLPEMEKGDAVTLRGIDTEQHFTEPPPRYTEASLVKTLEEYGIGRPSTYASIISTLVNREYVELESRRFTPTDVGKIVNVFLTRHFPQYVDYEFTARMEDSLDEVFRGEREWVPLMREFWKSFKQQVEEKEATVTREEAVQARELGSDPESGRPMTVRMGRYGPFVQIGTRDDEEKPRFAGLRPGQKMDQITLEEALELFKLPRQLGETADGEEILVNIGRFGPYVRFGSRFASIPKDEDPYTLDRERALELIDEKKRADANRIIRNFEDGVQVLNGRYGPYVTDGEKNAKIPKDREPKSLTREQCQELLDNAPVRRRGAKKKVAKKAAAKKTAAKKPATKKAAKKPAAKKAATGKKKAAKKKVAKKAAAKKTASRKTAAKKPASRKPEERTGVPRIPEERAGGERPAVRRTGSG